MNRNVERYHRARCAAEAFEQALCKDIPSDKGELLRDLLTDLRHYCAFERLDFESALKMSEIHFAAETE
jgi:hypothetical protein